MRALRHEQILDEPTSGGRSIVPPDAAAAAAHVSALMLVEGARTVETAQRCHESAAVVVGGAPDRGSMVTVWITTSHGSPWASNTNRPALAVDGIAVWGVRIEDCHSSSCGVVDRFANVVTDWPEDKRPFDNFRNVVKECTLSDKF